MFLVERGALLYKASTPNVHLIDLRPEGTYLCLGLRDVVPANLDPRLEEGLREVVDVDTEQMRDL